MTSGRFLVLVACLVASLSYAGAVTAPALWTLVLPAVAIVGAVGLILIRRPAVGLMAVILSAGAVGEVVNVLSGDSQGSVARSAFGAGLLTGMALLGSSTRRPASFLLGIVGIVTWALALGSGGRVALIAVLAAGLGTAALASVERDRRRYVAAPQLAPTLLLVLVITVAAGVAAALVQLRGDGRAPAAPFRSSQTVTVQPPAFLSLVKHPPRSATARPSISRPVKSASTQLKQEAARSRRFALVAIFAFVSLLALLFVALVLRWLWVEVTWRLLRRRLRRRASSHEVAAWSWLLAVAHRVGEPFPLDASPDVVLEQSPSPALRALAMQVSQAAFAPSPVTDTQDCWIHADLASHQAWSSASRGRRVRARLRRAPRLVAAH